MYLSRIDAMNSLYIMNKIYSFSNKEKNQSYEYTNKTIYRNLITFICQSVFHPIEKSLFSETDATTTF